MEQTQNKPVSEQRVELTIDNLFELMLIFINKGIQAECFDEQFKNQIKQCFEYFNVGEGSFTLEESLNTVIKGYNIIQEKGKYSLMDAFNVVQLVFFIQNNLEKIKEKIMLNKKQKEDEKTKELEKEKVKQVEKVKEEDEYDLSELTEPIPLKGKIINI